MNNSKLVYSTNASTNESLNKPSESGEMPVGNFTAILSIVKAGRRGKIVTLIDRLPKNTDYLKSLTADLKKKCGAGGTFKLNNSDGMIEIQGDKRDVIRQILTSKEIRFKG